MRRFSLPQISVLLLGMMMMMTLPARGQDLAERLQKLAEKNAPGYLGPLATSVGMGLNSGIIKTAKLHGVLGFDLTVHGGLIVLPSEAKTYLFDPSELGTISFDMSVNGQSVAIAFDAAELYEPTEAPTIFGSDTPPTLVPNEAYAESQIVQRIAQATGRSESEVRALYGDDINQAIQEYLYLDILPPGLNLDLVPIAAVRGSLGLPMGTELTGHFMPAVNVKDIGNVSAWGIGGRISLDQFIPIPFFPLDIAAGGFLQKIKVGPATADSYIIHGEISKKLAILDVYVGAGVERTTLSADYEYQLSLPDGTIERRNLSVSLEGANTFRITGGLRLALGPLFVSGEYTQGRYTMFAISTGISIR